MKKEGLKKVLEDTERFLNEPGWMVMAVGPGDDKPGFAYTVGLIHYDHPEVIVFGLPPTTAHSILGDVAERVKAGEMLLPNSTWEDFTANGLPAKFIVAKTDDLNLCGRYFEEFTALQLVWPDKEGRFPWEPGWDKKFDAHQSLLGKWEG